MSPSDTVKLVPERSRRPANVHSADGWDHVLFPTIDSCRAHGQTVVVRADALFATPAVLSAVARVERG